MNRNQGSWLLGVGEKKSIHLTTAILFKTIKKSIGLPQKNGF